MGLLEVRSRESSRQRKLTWSGEPLNNWWFHKGYEDTKPHEVSNHKLGAFMLLRAFAAFSAVPRALAF